MASESKACRCGDDGWLRGDCPLHGAEAEPAEGAVYVDDAFVEGEWGKWTGGGHLQADTLDILHAFAARLGLRREWFQDRPGRPERSHYDVTRSMRDRAIYLGAVPESVEDGTLRRRAARDARQRGSGQPQPKAEET